jgi:hypothetical protein
MGNHNIVWVGMDTDAKKNQIALYRSWDKELAAEWEVGMDGKGIRRLIERLQREDGEIRCVYEAGPCGYEFYHVEAPVDGTGVTSPSVQARTVSAPKVRILNFFCEILRTFAYPN